MSPLDNEGMVDLLHTHGVNMRYLGRMSHLAHTQEAQDIDLLLSNRQRIQAMPLFWLEMIEIEIIARCFKHHLNRLYRENKDIRQSPSPTIATLLNHILGQSVTSTSTATTTTPQTLSAENGVHTNTNISASSDRKRNDTEKDNTSKLKKKKIKNCQLSEDCSISIPELCDAGGSRGDCIRALGVFAATRFGLLKPALINFKAGNDNVEKTVDEREGEVVEKEEGEGEKGGGEGEGEKEGTVGDKDSEAVVAEENKQSSLPFLNDRITRLTLLRRLCQIAGLRIASRDFDFTSPHPFSRDDIVSVVPIVRSAQQTTPIPEVTDIISNARSCIEEGDLTGAFELSQDASRLLHQITGPLHKETVMSTNLITQILLEARNNSLALTMAFKSLSISVQLAGLDSQDAAQHHGQVASLLCDLGYPLKALQHFLAMRYLVELMAGPRHPELVNVYLRLVSIYEQQREYATAQVLLSAAKDLCVDVAKQCMISTTVAEIYDKMGELSNAVTEQRAVLRTMVQLFGPKDEKSMEAKSKMEKYLRKLTVSNVNAARGVGSDNEKLNLLRDLEENIKKAMTGKGKEKGKGKGIDGKGDNEDDDYLQLIAEGESKKDEKKKINSSNKKKSKNKSKK
jgi:Translation initiation factor eIF3 subunit 135